MDKQQILDAFLYRHACKEFDPGASISEDDFQCILEAGRLSPSSFGFEPWKFLVIQNPQLREKFLPSTWGGKKQIPTASHFLVCLAMKAPLLRYDSARIADFMREVQKLPEERIAARIGYYGTFQRSDFQLLESERALFDWSCKQCYLAQANMLTVAAMLGVDSCPIEGFVRTEAEALLAEHFGVDLNEYGLAYMLTFGYRIETPKQKTRRAMEQIVEWF